MEIEWDPIEGFYFVPYLPKKEVSQTGIFLDEQIVKAWGDQSPPLFLYISKVRKYLVLNLDL